MTKKLSRTYKTLTAKQTTKVKRYTKQGKSQQAIAKLLGVSKQRVSTAQKKAKIGKRVASAFWKDVALYKEKAGVSHRRATLEVKNWKEWGTKRATKAGKKWKSYAERQADMRKIREEFVDETDKRKAINQELEDYMYGDTPK